jgi:hypothetical protein
MWFVYLAAVLFSIGHSAGTPTYGAVIADIFSGFCFAISGLAIHACLKWHARHSAQQAFRS